MAETSTFSSQIAHRVTSRTTCSSVKSHPLVSEHSAARREVHSRHGHSYISKGIWRQGTGSFVNTSYVSTLCPVAICPYLCGSDIVCLLGQFWKFIRPFWDCKNCQKQPPNDFRGMQNMARDRLGRSLGLSVPLDSAVSAALPFWCHACYFLFPAFHFAASAVVYSGASEFYKGGDSTENDPLVSIDSGVILGNATHCFSWGGSCWWEEVSRAALSDGTKHALTSTCTDE